MKYTANVLALFVSLQKKKKRKKKGTFTKINKGWLLEDTPDFVGLHSRALLITNLAIGTHYDVKKVTTSKWGCVHKRQRATSKSANLDEFVKLVDFKQAEMLMKLKLLGLSLSHSPHSLSCYSHSLSLSLSRSLSLLSCSLSLSRSLHLFSLARSLTHSLSLTFSLTHSCSLSHSLAHSLTLTLSLTHHSLSLV
jgi:hypothetical protein